MQEKTIVLYMDSELKTEILELEGNQAKYDGMLINVNNHPHSEEFFETFTDQETGLWNEKVNVLSKDGLTWLKENRKALAEVEHFITIVFYL